MVDVAPEFETKDQVGKTLHFNGNVGTSPTLIPASQLGVISKLAIRNSNSNQFNKSISVSFDGANYWTLQKGELIVWEPKNKPDGSKFQQFTILGNDPTVAYEIILNIEPIL